ARVLEYGRGLQESLEVRLYQAVQVEIRRLPDGYGQRVVGVVEEVLNDRDMLVLVIHDLVDQLRAQAGQLVQPCRTGPPGSQEGRGRHRHGGGARRPGQEGTPRRDGLIALGRSRNTRPLDLLVRLRSQWSHSDSPSLREAIQRKTHPRRR